MGKLITNNPDYCERLNVIQKCENCPFYIYDNTYGKKVCYSLDKFMNVQMNKEKEEENNK